MIGTESLEWAMSSADALIPQRARWQRFARLDEDWIDREKMHSQFTDPEPPTPVSYDTSAATPSRARDHARAAVKRAQGLELNEVPVQDVAVQGMQKWEGRVTDVDENLFTVELTPLFEGGAIVLGDFETELLGSADTPVPGDIVYVTVRTVTDARGRHPARTASVRLRRLGHWTSEDVAGINSRARRRFESLKKYAE